MDSNIIFVLLLAVGAAILVWLRSWRQRRSLADKFAPRPSMEFEAFYNKFYEGKLDRDKVRTHLNNVSEEYSVPVDKLLPNTADRDQPMVGTIDSNRSPAAQLGAVHRRVQLTAAGHKQSLIRSANLTLFANTFSPEASIFGTSFPHANPGISERKTSRCLRRHGSWVA